MAIIKGNTYAVKDQLKAMGGRWDAAQKAWIVPDDKAGQALHLVSHLAPGKPYLRKAHTCANCGCRINYGQYCGKCEFGR